jgi:predicted nuclease with TOPRIM domain
VPNGNGKRKKREEIKPKLENATKINVTLKNDLNQIDAELDETKRQLIEKLKNEPSKFMNFGHVEQEFLKEILSKLFQRINFKFNPN